MRCLAIYRYSNIFVTAPSPENLKTLFDFVCKGFAVLEYKVPKLLCGSLYIYIVLDSSFILDYELDLM